MEQVETWQKTLASREACKAYDQSVAQADAEIGAFLEINSEKGFQLSQKALQENQKAAPLQGIPFAVKDNIAIEGYQLSCGSKVLGGFVAPYTATAVERLLKAGAIPTGKLNLDEFGMGSSTENSAWKKTCNPWNLNKVPGGSSGGSAAAVAARMVPFALGSDTGGSVRQPAAFCGVYGLKPTYGSVSRYGLVAYASSLECIGILGEEVELVEAVYSTIQGMDPMDQSSLDKPAASLEVDPDPDAGFTVGIIKDNDKGLDPGTAKVYRETVEGIKALGWKVKEITLDALSYVVPVYYTIATAEASANLARYTGIRYGYRADEYTDFEAMTRMTREQGFGSEVKLRILLGTYVLRSGFQDQYYIKAQKIRTHIRAEIAKAFQDVDLILSPVFPTQAFDFGGVALTPFQQKVADRYTVTANLSGIPALSFPAGKEQGLPVGMQFLSPWFQEKRLFSAARKFTSVYTPELLPSFMTKGGVK